MHARVLRLICRYKHALAFIAVILIAALPLFAHLDEAPIRQWDELRNAQNAFEMQQGSDWIVTTFQHHPETWNTKPPLLTWIQAACLRLFGDSELSIRLPSAVAGLLTCLLLLVFLKRRTGHWRPGILAVLILVTSADYVGMHGTRTGDFDALLTLFSTAALLFLVNFVEEERALWLWLSAVSLTLAVLTKGVAGLFVLPAMVFYSLIQKKGLGLLRRPAFYGGLLVFVITVGGYYWLRETRQPGYLAHVWENELGGRYQTVIETHDREDSFYLKLLGTQAFSFWYWLIIPSCFVGLFSRNKKLKRVSIAAVLGAGLILLIISTARTKLDWYLIPALPFLAMLCAIGLYQGIQFLKDSRLTQRLWSYNFLPVLLILCVVPPAYLAILDTTVYGNFTREAPGVNDIGVYMKEVLAGSRTPDASLLCGDSYPVFWYQEVLRSKGVDIPDVNRDSLRPGMKVIVWEQGVKDYIHAHYAIASIQNWRMLSIYQIGDSEHSGKLPQVRTQ